MLCRCLLYSRSVTVRLTSQQGTVTPSCFEAALYSAVCNSTSC
nr:MAG TPA: hypothetical protein [Caudoviricetes sp.]